MIRRDLFVFWVILFDRLYVIILCGCCLVFDPGGGCKKKKSRPLPFMWVWKWINILDGPEGQNLRIVGLRPMIINCIAYGNSNDAILYRLYPLSMLSPSIIIMFFGRPPPPAGGPIKYILDTIRISNYYTIKYDIEPINRPTKYWII